jgi:glycosyltransferase involved in cell wall biosynthesis
VTVLLLHNIYRWRGGEERAVRDLEWLIPSHLGRRVETLHADSADLSAADAARGLLSGGLHPERVAEAVRRSGATVVHAHNIHPVFGWRALAAAREAGARVVLHLHNYRLVCAPGTCFTRGEDCTRCHGRRTWPAVRLNCRGSRAESLVYAVGLAAQQRGIARSVDAFVVPSQFALDRLLEIEAPVQDRGRVVPSVQREIAAGSVAGEGEFVLAAGRLTPEKGFHIAIAACRAAGLPLVIAGEGPAMDSLRVAASEGVTFTGQIPPEELASLRRRAGAVIVPSLYEEILPLSALEAMAAGVPVVASASGGLKDYVPAPGLFPTGDSAVAAQRLRDLWRSTEHGERGLAVVRERCAPEAVASALAAVYDG